MLSIFASNNPSRLNSRRHVTSSPIGFGKLLLAGLLLLTHPASAQNGDEDYKEDLNAEEIQALVRYSNAAQNSDLHGNLRNARGQNVRFRLTMQDRYVRFAFDNPRQIIQLDIKDSSYLLREAIGGKEGTVPFTRYAESIRGSDIWFEDLAMRYLYWPNPELEGEDRIKTRKCWKLRIYNPTNLGPYHAVEVWVDQKSGGIMKMQGYNYEGKMIKRCTVNSGHKLKTGAWVLKEMRVESFKPGEGSPYARSYLEIDKPKE